MDQNIITDKIIKSSIEVHNFLGPGLLETSYKICLIHELKNLGLNAKSEIYLPIKYKGIELDIGYRIDLLVEDQIIVELKACRENILLHKAQLFTYLKISNLKLGLLINFNNKLLKDGIFRVINPHIS